MTASVISAQEGIPSFARVSNTWVAQMTGIWVRRPKEFLLEPLLAVQSHILLPGYPANHNPATEPAHNHQQRIG